MAGVFPERIDTESLTLRRLSDADPFELYGCFAADSDDAAGVFEHVPQEPYATVKEAHDDLVDARSDWEDGDDAEYGVYPAADTLAGRAVLVPEWDRRTGRLGVILARPFWGEGYAGECALALTELAFDRLDLELVAIGHEAGNERSNGAVQKFVESVGGQYDGVLRNWTPIGDEIADHHRYTVSREEFREVESRSGNR